MGDLLAGAGGERPKESAVQALSWYLKREGNDGHKPDWYLLIEQTKAIANWLCDGRATASDFFVVYDRLQREPEWRVWIAAAMEAEFRASEIKETKLK